MKKKIEKLTVVIMAVFMLMAIAPLANSMGLELPKLSFSASAYYTEAGLKYNVYNGKATVTELSDSSITDLVIPETLGGYPVTKIDSSAFENCKGITSVTIPDYITSIGYNAFNNCKNLKNVFITDLEAWCKINFEYEDRDEYIEGSYRSNPMSYADCLYLNGDLITSLVIPDDVTEICDVAFMNCKSITSVTIPNSLTSIDSYAFYGCTNLKSVYITDLEAWCNIIFKSTPMEYADSLYLNGNLITDLVIPEKITKIGGSAFENCKSITTVTIPDSVTTIGSGAFMDCTRLTNITIPNGVTSINAFTFYGCRSLTDVTIPNSVTNIDTGAFEYCFGLNKVTIPNNVTSIGYAAFSGCINLTAVTIGNSVTSIDTYAFKSCTSLIDVTIPDSVTSIGSGAFIGCTSLTAVTIPETVEEIGGIGGIGGNAFEKSVVIFGYPFSVAENYSLFYGNTFVSIPDHVHSYEKSIIKKATCTENGQEKCTCICGKSYINEIPATGHNFSRWVVSSEPTCTANGKQIRICACGEIEEEVIPSFGGHSDSDGDGLCDRCGENMNGSSPSDDKSPITLINKLTKWFKDLIEKIIKFFHVIGDRT